MFQVSRLFEGYRSAIAAILLISLIFIFSAQRGFELSDEGYYLTKFEYGYSLKFAVRGFYLYLSIPFKLLGGNIFLLRLFAYSLLLLSGYYFGKSWLGFIRALFELQPQDKQYPSLIIAICSLYYYAPYTTLMTPSYNWLTLICQLLATGLALKLLTSQTQTWLIFLYGFLISIATINKFSSGLILFLTHLILFSLFYSRIKQLNNLRRLHYALVGFAFNIIFVKLAVPDFAEKFQHGIEYIMISSPRSILKEMIELVTQSALLEMYISLVSLGLPLMLLLAGCYFLKVKAPHSVGLFIFLGVFYVITSSSTDSFSSPRLFHFVLLGLFLSAVSLIIQPCKKPLPQIQQFGLYLIFILMPIGFSLGTLLRVLSHANMAMIFPCAFNIGLLDLLFIYQRLGEKLYKASLLCFCLPIIVLLVKPWFDVADTYRLNTSLFDQNIAFSLNKASNQLKLDKELAHSLAEYQLLLAQSGFKAATPMLDFTGASPGLVYLAQGRPLGGAWLIGGYPGSTEAAHYVMNLLDKDEIKSAWLLTSDNHERRLDEKALLIPVLGDFPYTQVGSIRFAPIDYFNQAPTRTDIIIKVWKPKP